MKGFYHRSNTFRRNNSRRQNQIRKDKRDYTVAWRL